METYNLRVNISSDVSSFISGLGSIGGELQGMEREVTSSLDRVEQSFKSAGEKITKIGAGLTAGLTVPLTIAGKNIWDDGMPHSEQMARVRAVGQLTQDEYDKLHKQTIQVGAETVFGALDVAIAQEEMLKKGFSVDDVEIAVPGVMDLATISGKDVQLAADTMSSILNAYDMDKSDANKVTDILAQGSISSALDVRDIGYAMSYAGTNMASFNVSLEETVAMLGIMADRGIAGSKGGTMLSRVLQQLRTPSGKAAEDLESLGVKAYDATGKARPLYDIFDDLNKAFKGMTDSEIDSYLGKIFWGTRCFGCKSTFR